MAPNYPTITITLTEDGAAFIDALAALIRTHETHKQNPTSETKREQRRALAVFRRTVEPATNDHP